jgi:hypothetical protein
MSIAPEFTVRFGVGAENGPRSGVWRVWANRGKSDVYVAIRMIAGLKKISLHATGNCNASMTSQEAKNNPTAVDRLGGTRHIDKWHRPVGTGELLSIPLRIRFPESELRSGTPSPKETKIHWLAPPPVDHSIDVVCIFTSDSLSPAEWPWKSEGGEYIASTQLPNGETFWLISILYRTGPELTLTLDSRKPAGMPAQTRLLIGEAGPGNIRILTDAAIEPSVRAAA